MKTLVTTCVNCVIGYKVVVLKTHFSVFKRAGYQDQRPCFQCA